MRLIDADKLHREEIDDIICYSVQQIENAPTVDVLDKIRDEIEDYVCNKEENTMKAQGMLNALRIMEKYIESEA